MVVAVLFIDGNHVPLIGVVFVDEVGSGVKLAPEQIAETGLNVGVIGSVTVMIAVLEQPKLFL